MAKPPGKLTPQQKIFIGAFVACRNATKAAEIAEYACPKDSGYELLNKPQYLHVQVEVERQLADVILSLKKWRNRLITRAIHLSFFDVTKVLEDGSAPFVREADCEDDLPPAAPGITLKPLDQIDPEDAACLAGITIKEFKGGSSVTVKVPSPAPYLKMLFQAAGLLGTQVEDNSKTEAEIEDELRGRFSQLADEVFPPEAPPEEKPKEKADA